MGWPYLRGSWSESCGDRRFEEARRRFTTETQRHGGWVRRFVSLCF
jgi:hypothetical protein